MINMTIRKEVGGKTFFCGLEKDDLVALSKDGILSFDLPAGKVAIMIVKTSREEFMANVRKLTDIPEPSPSPASSPADTDPAEGASSD